MGSAWQPGPHSPTSSLAFKGGLYGSFGGAGSAAFGCVTEAFAEYAKTTNSRTLRFTAFALQLKAAGETYKSIKAAQADARTPFKLWSKFMAHLR